MPPAQPKKTPSPEPGGKLIDLLARRFTQHPQRHPGIGWAKVLARLEAEPESLRTLEAMEATGGGPDVVGQDPATKEFLFVDCSPETPKGRVSVCYDRAGWESRKEHRPKTNAMDLAAEIGVNLLSEQEYAELQKLGEFDLKTSSWIATPPEIRRLGGALYSERRYGRVFVGHNGAQSYYAVRGFRGMLRV